MPGETTTTTAPATGTAAPPVAPVEGAPVAPKVDAGDGSMITAPAAKPTDAKPTDAKPPIAPAAIELKLPEGFDDKDPLIAGFRETAGKLGLKSDQAQGILDLYAKDLKLAVEADNARRKTESEAGRAAMKADPEYGGAKYQQSLVEANSAIDRAPFAAELRQALHSAGLLDHPAVVKTFAFFGRSLKEDTVRGANGAPTANADDWARIAFPNTPSLHK